MRKAVGWCSACRETLFYDTEAGEPVPHNCPMEVLTAYENPTKSKEIG